MDYKFWVIHENQTDIVSKNRESVRIISSETIKSKDNLYPNVKLVDQPIMIQRRLNN